MRPFPGELVERLRSGGRDLTVVVLRLGALGDILRTLPVVRLVREAMPRARIVWVVDDRWASILEGHPALDVVVSFPRAEWRRAARSPGSWPALRTAYVGWTGRLRALGAGLALDFHGNLRSAWIGRISGAPVRLGYGGHQQKEGNRWFTTHRVPAGPRRTSRLERNLSLIRALGIPDRPLPDGGLPMPAAAQARAAEIAASLTAAGRPYAVISPGASRGQAYKKPPAPLLAAAAQALARTGIASIVVHGPGESEDAEAVAREAGPPARVAPPTDLRELGALLRGARLFVGGDTGPLHLACAVGCPVVGIYGPTDPVVNAPWGVDHLALCPPGRAYTGIKRRDRDGGGFEGLEPERVAAAVEAFVASR